MMQALALYNVVNLIDDVFVAAGAVNKNFNIFASSVFPNVLWEDIRVVRVWPCTPIVLYACLVFLNYTSPHKMPIPHSQTAS